MFCKALINLQLSTSTAGALLPCQLFELTSSRSGSEVTNLELWIVRWQVYGGDSLPVAMVASPGLAPPPIAKHRSLKGPAHG